MSLADKISTLQEFGIVSSLEFMTSLLRSANGDVTRAASNYFETPSLQKKASEELQKHGSATAALTGKGNDENNARQNEFSSSAFALASSWDFPLLEPCRAYADTVRGFHLVGRRLVDAYAISSGTLERQQLIKFTVEGKKINKLGAASPFSSSLSLFKDESSAKKTARKKKVFTGGRIFFDTINTSRSGTSDSCARGRIDNNLCDFLLPLLECDLIVLSGHIAYDCGKARTMVTIPISMHVMVSDEFLELSQECEDKTVLEAANDLMIWITEGDQALAQSRQQRESEVNPHFKKDGSKSVSDDIAEEVNTEVNEEGLTMSEADLGPVEMSVDEIVQPVKAELPLASQPSLMSPEIQMKDYQLQALFWMKGREVIKPEADSEDEQVSPTNDSKDSIVADTKVIVLEDSNDGNCCTEVHSLSRCESQRLSCPHNGVLEFPKNWGTQKREMNPLWQPVAALCMIWLRNLERSSSTHLFSPQSVPEIVPKVAAKDWTVFWWDRYSLKFQKQPPLAPKQCNGGLLADEMGLGKTIMVISLLADHKEQLLEREGQHHEACTGDVVDIIADSHAECPSGKALKRKAEEGLEESTKKRKSPRLSIDKESTSEDKSNERSEEYCGVTDFTTLLPHIDRSVSYTMKTSSRLRTLIVCPMTLMSQWIEEIANRLDPRANVTTKMYYNSNRHIDEETLSNIDIVVTSYGILVSEAKIFFNRARSNGGHGMTLMDVDWHRVVLDEAHMIKNPLTDVAQACFLVKSKCRWALTGTPIQNSLNDIHSLVKFLRHEPWDQGRWWKKVISEPHTAGDNRGMKVLRELLGEIMVRRTKDEKDSAGRSIVQLPGKHLHILKVNLTEAEREFYDAIMNRSKAVCKKYELEAMGFNPKNKYAALFTLLLRLRQACAHPFLVIKTVGEDETNKISDLSMQSSSSAMSTSIKDDVSSGHDAISSPPIDSIAEEVPELNNTLDQTFLNSIFKKLQQSFMTRSVVSSSGSASADRIPSDRSPPGTDSSQFIGKTGYLAEVMNQLKDYAATKQGSPSIDTLQEGGLNASIAECSICFEDYVIGVTGVVTICGHMFCRKCALDYVRSHMKCPTCSEPLSIEGVLSLCDRKANTGRDLPISASNSLSAGGNIAGVDNHPTIDSNTAYALACKQYPKSSTINKENFSNRALTVGSQVKTSKTLYDLGITKSKQQSTSTISSDKSNAKKTSIVDDYRNMSYRNWQRSKGHRTDVDFFSSSKIDAMLQLLDVIFASDDKGVKVVVFSQWTTMLDLVEEALHFQQQKRLQSGSMEEDAVDYSLHCRLDGSMSQPARSAAVQRFHHDERTKIFLISLKAGGLGLNLTTASSVILLDPWWNPSPEDQAIDRIYRLGQTREVNVYRLICEETVEERLLEMQNKKRALSQQAIGNGLQPQTENKLSLEDLKSFFL